MWCSGGDGGEGDDGDDGVDDVEEYDADGDLEVLLYNLIHMGTDPAARGIVCPPHPHFLH